MDLIKKSPNWLKVIFALILSLAIFADVLYIYLAQNAPNKDLLTTVNASTLYGVENDDTKNIITVRYYANADNSGVELFDFRLNYVTNANTTDVMSVGIQLVGDSSKKISTKLNQIEHTSIDWVSTVLKWSFLGVFGLVGGTPQKIDYISYEADFDADVYTYAMYDDLSYSPTAQIDDSSAFLLSIDEKTTLMLGFTGDQTTEEMTDENGKTMSKNYMKYDINYLVYKLFNSLGGSQLPYGTNGTYKFEFDERIFTYKQDVGNNTYEDILDNTQIDKINNQLVSYYSIKVETFERGALKASDSLFNSIKSQSNFSLTDNVDVSAYHSRYQVVNLTEQNFKIIQTDLQSYDITLTSASQKQLKLYKNAMFIVVIDLDKLGASTSNVTFNFIFDDYLNKTNIFKVFTKRLINGETVIEGVNI